jgi:hypothetical protein
MARKTADEIAALFFERFREQEPQSLPDEGFGPYWKWESWITRKQVNWLTQTFMRENPDATYNRHNTVSGYFKTDWFSEREEQIFWSLYVSQQGSGVLRVRRYI